MIAIINIGPAPGNKRRTGASKGQPIDPLGAHVYSLRINHHVVTTFTHTRGASLGDCLRQAAAAADRHREAEVMRLIQETAQATATPAP